MNVAKENMDPQMTAQNARADEHEGAAKVAASAAVHKEAVEQDRPEEVQKDTPDGGTPKEAHRDEGGLAAKKDGEEEKKFFGTLSSILPHFDSEAAKKKKLDKLKAMDPVQKRHQQHVLERKKAALEEKIKLIEEMLDAVMLPPSKP